MADSLKFCSHCEVLHPLTEEFWYIRTGRIRCREVVRHQRRTYKSAHPGKGKESLIKHKKRYPERVAASRRRWVEANPAQVRLIARRHYRKDLVLSRMRSRVARALYRTRQLQATPCWADLVAIKKFYENCPEGYHVDHIAPLQGKTICGLHVLENLQYLTASENCRKGNTYGG
jgi:hypothetical protein